MLDLPASGSSQHLGPQDQQPRKKTHINAAPAKNSRDRYIDRTTNGIHHLPKASGGGMKPMRRSAIMITTNATAANHTQGSVGSLPRAGVIESDGMVTCRSSPCSNGIRVHLAVGSAPTDSKPEHSVS